ncbi:hypothetical protein [Variovorax sp. W2I14]|uniref:hypothetical protein n=1 Tax=Variovorax sp. W2I14 TaxID=3042290 RepID=UPI003D1D58FA
MSTRTTPEDIEGMSLSPASIVLYHGVLGIGAVLTGLILALSSIKLGAIIGALGVVLSIYSLLHFIFASRRIASILLLAGVAIAFLGFGNTLIARASVFENHYVSVIFLMFFAFGPVVYAYYREKKHLDQLIIQSHNSAGALVIKGLLGKEQRELQAIQAKKDMDAGAIQIDIGISTGAFRDVISPSIADPGLKLGMSTKDTNYHTWITGATGKGKSGSIRQVAYTVARSEQFGMLVACGKGSLPFQLKKTLHYLITPDKPYNIFAKLTPTDGCEALRARYISRDVKDPFWPESALSFINVCWEFMDALCHSKIAEEELVIGEEYVKYNPQGLVMMSRLLQSGYANAQIIDLIRKLHPEMSSGFTPLASAIYYIEKKFDAFPEQTKESILATANLWLSHFTSNPDMAGWASADAEPISMKECFTEGKRIGIGFGEDKGACGSLYLHFINREFKRAAFETPTEEKKFECFYVFDECFSIVALNTANPTRMDDDVFASLCREWKVHLIYCSQSMSQLLGRFSEAVVHGYWGNFNNFLDLGSNDPKTEAYLRERLGVAPRYIKDNMPSESIDFLSTYNRKAAAPMYDEMNPNMAAMKNAYGLLGLDGGYDHKKRDVGKFPVITIGITKPDQNISILDEKTYTKFSNISRVGLFLCLRAGLRRVDYVKLLGVDPDGNPYPEVELDKEFRRIEGREEVRRALVLVPLLNEGKVAEATALAMKGDL